MKLAFPIATADTADTAMLALRGQIEANFSLLAKLGYGGTELMIRDPAQLDAAAIRRSAGDLGIVIGAVSTGQLRKEDGLSLCSPDEALRRRAIDRMKAVIDFAAEFRAHVNVGTVRGHLPSRDAARESFRELLAHADGAGVDIAIEPQCRWVINWLHTVEETLEFIADSDSSRLKVLYDLYHATLEERSPIAGLIRAKDRLAWVQICDSNRQSPGAGHQNFVDPIETLRALGYAGFVSIECLPLPDAAEAAKRAIAVIAPLLAPPS